jgi:non-heme Fe2+,alpha-ketoglutarate-dependent halogenase
MNISPKVRPVWKRCLIMAGMSVLLAWKALRLPTFFLPKDVESVIKNWHYKMYWVILKSFQMRAYIDEPCELPMPASCKPKAEVDPQFAMSEDEIRGFYENGWAGPFDAFSAEEIRECREQLVTMRDSVSETYGFVTPRDRHFENPMLMKMMSHPAIVERSAQLLGPDLSMWRSQIFFKEAGSPMIQWHQASTFMVEDYIDPAIFPKNLNELYQVTIWIAVDRSTRENGCLRFVRGTHSSIRTIRVGGEGGFYKANYSLEFDLDESKVAHVEAEPGQFIMFTERCIHGSAANESKNDRLAFNMRLIPADIAVYPGKEKYRSLYNGGKYHLDKWGVVVMRGQAPVGLNRTIDKASLLPREVDSPAKRAA